MSDLERRYRRLLAAWPARARKERGDEIIATTLEIAERRGRSPGVTDGVRFVMAGLGARLRRRPPFHWWLSYRLFGARLPDRYHEWMLDDLRGPGWRRRWFGRDLMTTAIWVLMLLGLSRDLPNSSAWVFFVAPAVFLGVSSLSAERNRNKALARHGYDPKGVVIRRAAVPAPVAPRPVVNRALVPGFRRAGLIMTFAAPSAAAALLWPATLTIGPLAIGSGQPLDHAVAIVIAATVVGIAAVLALGASVRLGPDAPEAIPAPVATRPLILGAAAVAVVLALLWIQAVPGMVGLALVAGGPVGIGLVVFDGSLRRSGRAASTGTADLRWRRHRSQAKTAPHVDIPAR